MQTTADKNSLNHFKESHSNNYKEQLERQKYNLKSFIFVVAFISAAMRLVCCTLDVRSLWNMPLLCRYCSPRAISRDRAILTPHDRYRSLSNSCSRLPPFMYCTERDNRARYKQDPEMLQAHVSQEGSCPVV